MKLSEIFAWLLKRTRPEFHYATLVLAFSATFIIWAIVPLAILFEVLNAFFDFQARVRTELLANITGTMAFGGLVAGYLRHHLAPGISRRWVVAAMFGGVSAAAFGGLANFKWGDSIELGILIGFLIGALSGLVILWGYLPEARKDKASATKLTLQENNSAVCIRCGHFKLEGLGACKNCGFRPSSLDDRIRSLYLEPRFNGGGIVALFPAEIDAASADIKAGKSFAFNLARLSKVAEQYKRSTRQLAVQLAVFLVPMLVIIGFFFLRAFLA